MSTLALWGSVIGLAVLDSFNPCTVFTMLVLFPLVKKTSHTLYFLATTFIVYLVAGLLLFAGASNWLAGFLQGLEQDNSQLLAVLSIILGVLLFVIGLRLLIKIIRNLKAGKSIFTAQENAIMLEATPVGVVLIGIISTILDVPTAVPLLTITGIFTAGELAFSSAFIYYLIYTIIYVLPIILIYLVYTHLPKDKMQKFEVAFNRFVGIISTIVLPIMLIAIALYFLNFGINL